jgi:hypothetical protein
MTKAIAAQRHPVSTRSATTDDGAKPAKKKGK